MEPTACDHSNTWQINDPGFVDMINCQEFSSTFRRAHWRNYYPIKGTFRNPRPWPDKWYLQFDSDDSPNSWLRRQMPNWPRTKCSLLESQCPWMPCTLIHHELAKFLDHRGGIWNPKLFTCVTEHTACTTFVQLNGLLCRLDLNFLASCGFAWTMRLV